MYFHKSIYDSYNAKSYAYCIKPSIYDNFSKENYEEYHVW